MEKQFEYLLLDCVGPLKYLLTEMCKSTLYLAAFPLRSIKTKPALKALTSFLTSFGIPKVVQTDQGGNFMPPAFSQLVKQLKVKHQVSSEYHPESQGTLERFHQTCCLCCVLIVKNYLGNREKGLPWLMLAYRRCHNSNELVFGYTVWVPLAVLGDELKNAEPPDNVLNYGNGFRRQLDIACVSAHRNLSGTQKKIRSIPIIKPKPIFLSQGIKSWLCWL